ncbi:DMT family transporter [Pseudonocardia sp. GCM10023141]|uniref:DMT family transporter n=1 Tax=Pseudonocardia sp. GCM10023141 TaxID=3252653 RepID=UPI00361334EF
MSTSSTRRGELVVVASAITFGVAGALTVVALRTLRPADMLAFELTGSALVLTLVAALTGRLHRRGALRALAQGVVSPGLGFLLADLGLARTSATDGSLLLGGESVLTVLLAVVLLRERIGRTGSWALVLGLGGTALVSLGAGSEPSTASDPVVGNLLVIAAVLCGAAYVVWSRRSAQPAEESVGITAWQFIGATIAVSPFVLGSWLTGGSRFVDARPEELLAAAAVLVCSLVGLLLFNLGIAAITASRAGLLFTLQPVAGTLTAVLVLGETLGGAEAVGGALIVVGVIVLTRAGRDDDAGGSPIPAPKSTAIVN